VSIATTVLVCALSSTLQSRKGIDYLLTTQAVDGSRHVRTRSVWLQPYSKWFYVRSGPVHLDSRNGMGVHGARRRRAAARSTQR
jgi:hypothetical protein